jgi:hypothetical protein
MKKLVLTAICVTAISLGALAQGTFNFGNSAATLITLTSNGVSYGSTPASSAMQFRYQLFIAPAGTANAGSFTATSTFATNLPAVGRLNGGNGLTVPGTPAGGTGAVLLRGWSSNLGADYASALAAWNSGAGGWLGESSIAGQFLWGGDPGTGVAVPASPLFGGGNGIQTGFAMIWQGGVVPEPSSMALAGLGAASLLLFRRRK